ncbi:MAG: hypothetical protein AAF899_13170 [Pseudomonadota bacterium]
MYRLGTSSAVALALGLVVLSGDALAAPSVAPTDHYTIAPGANDTASRLLKGKPWYQGGTLHHSTLAEWSDATDRNRLATAGDWAVRMLSPRQLHRMGLPGIRSYAEALVGCIDDVAEESRSGRQQSSRVAAGCRLTLLSH